MYCEKCEQVVDNSRCPICGNRKLREPLPEDLCYIAEKDALWTPALADLLEQNEIFFKTRKLLGAGLAMKVGPIFERTSFYVRYEDLERAQDIVSTFFAETNTP